MNVTDPIPPTVSLCPSPPPPPCRYITYLFSDHLLDPDIGSGGGRAVGGGQPGDVSEEGEEGEEKEEEEEGEREYY